MTKKNKKGTYEKATIDDRLQRVHKLIRQLNAVATEVKWLHLAETALIEEEYEMVSSDEEDLENRDIQESGGTKINNEIELTTQEGKVNLPTGNEEVFTVDLTSNSRIPKI